MVTKSSNPSRAPLSCDACRRRKVKCDSAERESGRPCSKCEASELECSFTYTRKKRRPNLAPKSRKYGLETAQVLVEHIITALDEYSIPQDAETVREILISLARYARSLEIRLGGKKPITSTTAKTSSSSASKSPESGTLSDNTSDHESDDETLDLAADFKNMTFGHQLRHFGRSSNYLFLHTAMEIKENVPEKEKQTMVIRPEMWATDIWKWFPEHPPPIYTFPANLLLQDLIDIYFTEISPFTYPLLHRPTFERAVSTGLHLIDQHFGAVVLAVCALASRQSPKNDERNRINEKDYEQVIGWKWFRQIQLVRPSFENTTSVYELQLYCLACFYLQSTTISHACWPLVGLGIRLSHERGIHRGKVGQQRSTESELWLRAFWCLVGIDIDLGLQYGRPPATTPNDFDVDSLVECDDEEWESPTPFVQPAGKPSKASFGVYQSKLLQIAGSIQRTIYAIKRPDSDQSVKGDIEWNQKEVMKHDSLLNEWLDSLPEHLRWDPHRVDPVLFGQTVILHSTFYLVQSVLHKKFVMRIARTPLTSQPLFHSDRDSGHGSSPESQSSNSPSSSTPQASCDPANFYSSSRTSSRTGANVTNYTSTNKSLASMEMRMSFPSLAVCANAARCSVNIAAAYHWREEKDPALHPLPDILPMLGNTASILLVTLWRSKHSDQDGSGGSASAASRREWADLRKSFEIMGRYEHRHQAAGRLIDKFVALAKAEKLDTEPDPIPHWARGLKRRPEEADLDVSADTVGTWIPSSASLGIDSSSISSANSKLNSTTIAVATAGTTWSPFYPTPSLNSVTSSGFASSASARSNGTTGESQGNVNSGSGSGSRGLFDFSALLPNSSATAPQNQIRSLSSAEVSNGLFDEFYRVSGGNTEMRNMFTADAGLGTSEGNGVDGSSSGISGLGSAAGDSDTGVGSGNDSFDLGHLNALNPIELEDWNTFMQNVDEALFEVGLGR